ncbi:MAG: hypothetical protein KTR21_10435 [Rhodobacteraceae bacterium]|nr:hypothetical protein [Paracoccaceae bacterium]
MTTTPSPLDPPPAAKTETKATKHAAAPRPAVGYLSAAAAAAQQAVALAPVINDPRFPWRPELRPKAMICAQTFATAAPEQVRRAAAKIALNWLSAMLDGIDRYHTALAPPTPPEPTIIWRAGSARLLDFGTSSEFSTAPVLLALPSLINRARIFDLTPKRSFLRGLAARGVRPLLLDWGLPGPEERGFNLEAYVQSRALPAFEIAARLGRGQAAILGHCMSGALAIATAAVAAERTERMVSRTALMAAPWRFGPYRAAWPKHDAWPAPPKGPQLSPNDRLTQIIGQCEAVFGAIPSDVLNTLFFALDPLQALRKFPGYAALDPESPQAQLFVAVENWLNDGVPLATPVARTLFVEWGMGDQLAEGGWRVSGVPVRPRDLPAPLLVIASPKDTVVPYASATAVLADAPGARLLRPSGGHVGMIVGGKAEVDLWDPLARWLRE